MKYIKFIVIFIIFVAMTKTINSHDSYEKYEKYEKYESNNKILSIKESVNTVIESSLIIEANREQINKILNNQVCPSYALTK